MKQPHIENNTPDLKYFKYCCQCCEFMLIWEMYCPRSSIFFCLLAYTVNNNYKQYDHNNGRNDEYGYDYFNECRKIWNKWQSQNDDTRSLILLHALQKLTGHNKVKCPLNYCSFTTTGTSRNIAVLYNITTEWNGDNHRTNGAWSTV